MTVPQKKIIHRATLWLSNSTFKEKWKHVHTKNLCTSVASSIVHTSQKVECSTDEGINQKWYISTVGYYLATKRDGILLYAVTQMILENIMFSEIRDRKINII